MLSVARKRRVRLAWRIGERRAALFDAGNYDSNLSAELWRQYKELKSIEIALEHDPELVQQSYNRAFDSY